jgi:hypothetical protein
MSSLFLKIYFLLRFIYLLDFKAYQPLPLLLSFEYPRWSHICFHSRKFPNHRSPSTLMDLNRHFLQLVEIKLQNHWMQRNLPIHCVWLPSIARTCIAEKLHASWQLVCTLLFHQGIGLDSKGIPLEPFLYIQVAMTLRIQSNQTLSKHLYPSSQCPWASPMIHRYLGTNALGYLQQCHTHNWWFCHTELRLHNLCREIALGGPEWAKNEQSCFEWIWR